MIRRPFFNMGARPKLPYSALSRGVVETLIDVPVPDKAVLFHKGPWGNGRGFLLKKGDPVRTGQMLIEGGEGEAGLISTVTGKIADISTHPGYFGKTYPSVTIDVAGEDEQDKGPAGSLKDAPLDSMLKVLECVPGMPPLSSMLGGESPAKTLIIAGVDQDLLLTTQSFLLKTEADALREGVENLKRLTALTRVVAAVPPEGVAEAEKTGAEVLAVRPFYPNGLPRLIVKEVLGRALPPEKAYGEEGVAVVGIAAVAALQKALGKGELPLEKVLSVVKKDLSSVLVKVRIGTPVRKVLEALGIETGHGDRVVLGGPMTGEALISEDVPVLFDTEGILVQDKAHIVRASDTPCVNCGECVRACPAHIPVNMLVRFLENGLYQDAAQTCDLLYCVECGLCSYVCVARIPLFQYIMLGKSEYARKKSEEVAHA